MEHLFGGYKKALICTAAGLALVTTMACTGTVTVQPTEAPRPAPMPTSPLPPAAAPAEMTKVMVTLADGVVTLDMDTVPAGPVRFLVTNNGTRVHGFDVMGQGMDQKIAELRPGDTARLDVTLTPGEYEAYCTVPGHRENGMTTMFTVR